MTRTAKRFCPEAQGCRAAATLGSIGGIVSTPKGLCPGAMLERVRAYVADQERHHRRFDYQGELRALLRRHRLEWDERYLWDRGVRAQPLRG